MQAARREDTLDPGEASPAQGFFPSPFLEGEKWGWVQDGLLPEIHAWLSRLAFLFFFFVKSKEREGAGGMWNGDVYT